MWEELGERGVYVQNALYEILKELIQNERKRISAKKMNKTRKGVLCLGHYGLGIRKSL